MLPQMLAKCTPTSARNLLWAVIGALMLGQVVALWMLCSHQVRQAQARDAGVQMERLARADCLRQASKATPDSCASRATRRPEVSPARAVSVAFQ